MMADAETLSNSDKDFALLRERLHKAIPGGAHTYSRGDDQFPAIAPPLLERGKGAYVWDTQGNRFLDYGMALRAITLGYADGPGKCSGRPRDGKGRQPHASIAG